MTQRTTMEQSKIDNYVSARGAESYKADYDNKLHRRVSDRWERAIFARMFAMVGRSETLLDLPCGAGRLFDLFQSHARSVLEADFSPSMLRLNADDHGRAAAGYVRCSGVEIPFADGSVDTVVSVRLNHHLVQQSDRERHVRELLRVARRAVILTYFSHYSLKNWLRRLRQPFNKKGDKHTLSTRRVAELAREAGFVVRRLEPLSRFGSGHVFALLTRRA
ncbi:MAG: class I SAM-dependent methyltransferase [Planctomycetota bacterium]